MGCKEYLPNYPKQGKMKSKAKEIAVEYLDERGFIYAKDSDVLKAVDIGIQQREKEMIAKFRVILKKKYGMLYTDKAWDELKKEFGGGE